MIYTVPKIWVLYHTIVKTKMGKSKSEGSSYVYWRFDNCTESLLYELEQLWSEVSKVKSLI